MDTVAIGPMPPDYTCKWNSQRTTTKHRVTLEFETGPDTSSEGFDTTQELSYLMNSARMNPKVTHTIRYTTVCVAKFSLTK